MTPVLLATTQASGIASLGINLKSLIFQIIAFGIVLWLLNKFAIRNILANLDKRKDEMDKGLDDAHKASQALEDSTAKASETIRTAQTEAEKILQTATQQASKVQKDIEAKAKQQATRITEDAKQQLVRDVEVARRELVQETARLVAEVSGAVISEKLDNVKDMKLIESKLKAPKK